MVEDFEAASLLMPDLKRRFFLGMIDPQYGCAILEAMFSVSDLSELSLLLGSHSDGDPELRRTYWLDDGDLAALKQRYGVAIESDGRVVTLDRWHSIRAAPYLIHTNYELMLLLEGTKKFARMSEDYPPYEHGNESLFERHVALGFLHREVQVLPFAEPFVGNDGRVLDGTRVVYYTLKGEEWRIAAWTFIFSASQKTSWNETFERLEGMLFGYEEWQMDWWMAQWRRPPPIGVVRPVR